MDTYINKSRPHQVRIARQDEQRALVAPADARDVINIRGFEPAIFATAAPEEAGSLQRVKEKSNNNNSNS
jgi:hypothetical protein